MASLLKKAKDKKKQAEQKLQQFGKKVVQTAQKSAPRATASVATARPVPNMTPYRPPAPKPNMTSAVTKRPVNSAYAPKAPNMTSAVTKQPVHSSQAPKVPNMTSAVTKKPVHSSQAPSFDTKRNMTLAPGAKAKATPLKTTTTKTTTSYRTASTDGSSASSFSSFDAPVEEEVIEETTDFVPEPAPEGPDAAPAPTVPTGPAPLSAEATSAFSAYRVTPDTVSNSKKLFENFTFRLKETMNDSWYSKGTKEERAKGLFESTAGGYAKLFDQPADFDIAYNSSPEFRQNIDSFVKMGGDVNSIKGKIKPAATMPTATGNPATAQSTTEYLASISLKPPAGSTPEEVQAFNALIPERELAQKQIMRLAGVPEQYKDLYFGTPEQLGILEERRSIAVEKKKLLERKAKEDEKDLRAQARYAIDKNKADLEIAEAEIEENRLAAKNYATAQLAKLGALKTTGAAPVALATLEQKYQRQSLEIRNKVKFLNRDIEITLTDKVNDIVAKRDDDILKVREDLTKDQEEVMKEVFKLEQAADKEIYNLTDKAASELRTNTEKFRTEARRKAEQFVTRQESLMRTYNPAALLARYGVTNTSGKPTTVVPTAPGKAPGLNAPAAQRTAFKNNFISRGKKELRDVTGPDGKADPAVYLRMWHDWDEANLGTLASFKSTFPPVQYLNTAATEQNWPELYSLGFLTRKKGSSSSSRSVLPD